MWKVSSVSPQALAGVLDQSVDCVKLIDTDGNIRWMNSNGMCAMQIDDFAAIEGRSWESLWPAGSQIMIRDALQAAEKGSKAEFHAACPTAKGDHRFWHVTVSKVHTPLGEDLGFLAISRDVTSAETQRRALAIAAEEMRHRLRNTYAMIGSLLVGFARGDPAQEQFARSMQARLSALSAAQLLFTAADVPCQLDQLIPALAEAFDNPHCPVRITSKGSIIVDRGQADAIALVVGELAVNSAKHGAMGKGGSIAVDSVAVAEKVQIVWHELCQAKVTVQHRRGGQGLSLIQRIVEARGGTISVEWHEHGPTVSLFFPLREPS